MNRRAFLGAIGLAPVAAVAAVAKPTHASSGYVGDLRGYAIGESVAETVMPLERMKIINVFDPSSVGDYLATEEGERLILNAVRRNG